MNFYWRKVKSEGQKYTYYKLLDFEGVKTESELPEEYLNDGMRLFMREQIENGVIYGRQIYVLNKKTLGYITLEQGSLIIESQYKDIKKDINEAADRLSDINSKLDPQVTAWDDIIVDQYAMGFVCWHRYSKDSWHYRLVDFYGFKEEEEYPPEYIQYHSKVPMVYAEGPVNEEPETLVIHMSSSPGMWTYLAIGDELTKSQYEEVRDQIEEASERLLEIVKNMENKDKYLNTESKSEIIKDKF